jgi:hypothetical protein
MPRTAKKLSWGGLCPPRLTSKAAKSGRHQRSLDRRTAAEESHCSAYPDSVDYAGRSAGLSAFMRQQGHQNPGSDRDVQGADFTAGREATGFITGVER